MIYGTFMEIFPKLLKVYESFLNFCNVSKMYLEIVRLFATLLTIWNNSFLFEPVKLHEYAGALNALCLHMSLFTNRLNETGRDTF